MVGKGKQLGDMYIYFTANRKVSLYVSMYKEYSVSSL